MADNIRYKKLGANIRGLRKAYGETQLQLLLALGLEGSSPSTISQYETGDRIPERDILHKIAKHFLITEDELLHEDYSNIKITADDNIDNKAMIERTLPIIVTDIALSNSDFENAYNLHLELCERLYCCQDFEQSKFERCIELYEKASESGIIEATANSLWWIMFLGLLLSFMTPTMIEKAEAFNRKKISVKELVRDAFLVSFSEEDIEYEHNDETFEYDQLRADFLEENEVDMLVKIYKLKNSDNYSKLGDYYLAFRYLFGLTSRETSKEMNRAIGLEMMSAFSLMGNEYAKQFSNSSAEKV